MATNDTGVALVGTKDDLPQRDVSFGDLLALSKELVPTGFLPDHIKTPGQCAAIILTGRELGMGPMRALRSLQMVKGKVVENADSQLARFKADGGRAIWKQLTETKAVLWLKHPNGDEHTEDFTFEDAKKAGLTNASRNGEPSMFVKYPKAMLRSRAITAGLKSVGWEGGVGNYDPQEAAEFAPSVTVPPVSGEVEDAEPVPVNAPAPQRGPVLPFGKSKGTPLTELDDGTLIGALTWARDKNKYTEFQEEARAELDSRRLELEDERAAVEVQ